MVCQRRVIVSLLCGRKRAYIAGIRNCIRRARGDWIVMARHSDDKWPGMKELQTLPAVQLIYEKDFGDDIPLAMQDCYYGGASAIEHHEGPRMQVKVYRWE